jgi:hypothetical protein
VVLAGLDALAETRNLHFFHFSVNHETSSIKYPRKIKCF